MDFNQLTGWFQNLSQIEKILVILVALATAYFVYWQLGRLNGSQSRTGLTNGNYSNQWNDQGLPGFGDMNPADKLPELIKLFGPPSNFNGSPGGFAVWNKSKLAGTPFERLEIRDKLITHASPKPHTDFLYTWYKIPLSTRQANNLHKISQSLQYDPKKGEMIAGCHDLRPNVVSHWIVKQYAEDQLTLDEAAGMYPSMIMELMEDDETGMKYQHLLSEL